MLSNDSALICRIVVQCNWATAKKRVPLARVHKNTAPVRRMSERRRTMERHLDAPENKNAEYFCHGHLAALERFVEVCWLMKEQLWNNGEKFRVTIECDPEAGDFVMKREKIN